MKQLKLLFTVLFLSVLGLGNVWAEHTLVKANEMVSGEKYIITAVNSSTAYYLAPGSFSTGGGAATTYSSNLTEDAAWLFTKNGDNWTISTMKDGKTYYLSHTNTNNGVQSTTTSANYTIAASSTGANTVKMTSNSRVLSLYSTSNWRCYTSASGVQTISLYKVSGGSEQPTLNSVTVSGTPTKTTYEAGDAFDPAGLTVTGTYSEGDPKTITEGISWAVTPETLTEGLTSVSVTATVSGKTSAAYVVNGLTVNAAAPTASFVFNTDDGLSALSITKPAASNGTNLGSSAYTSGDISMTATDGSTATRVWNSAGATDLRIYNSGGTLTFTGATIKKIVLAGSATNVFTANVGTYTTNTWTGSATTVKLTATGTGKISTITVTYEAGSAAQTVATPVLPDAGEFVGSKEIALSCETAGAAIYYTLDGSDPTTSSTLYSGAFTISATTTVKAIAIRDGMTNSAIASATYTKVIALTTMDEIFAAATAAGSTATSKVITFDNWVISGVNGSNAYLTDNNGKGLIIYQSGHGFAVGDILSGTATCDVLLYNGSAELKNLTSTTDGLTVNGGGTITPITNASIASLGGINTGAVYSFSELTYNGTAFSDGENTITPYNTFITLPTLVNDKKYNVTGIYVQYKTTKEIAPRSESEIEMIAPVTVSSIAISGTATKTEYTVGSTFDKKGLTATATYSDGSTLDVTSSADWSFDPATLTLGTTTVNVTATLDEVPSAAFPVSVTVSELPVWASTYTSNVTSMTSNQDVKVKISEVDYDAVKANKGLTATVKIPAGATALHFHAVAWKDEAQTITLSSEALASDATFAISANSAVSGSGTTYTLTTDPTQDYYSIALSDIDEETTFTFTAASNKRFVLYGVNYVAPASVSLAPVSHDFEEVKENETAEFEFTATKNIFATGDIAVTFEGADAAAFSAGAVDVETGKFTVTFAPTEVREYSATVKVSVDGVEATATLVGEGISATTPTIATDVETIDFGKVKQDAIVEGKTVNVTLEYLAAANVAISGTVFSIDKTTLTETGAITISANTAAMGEYTETLTISGEGATSKTVTVTMEVVSKYASEYTSNVTVGNDKVIIDEVEYKAVKKGSSSESQSTTITVPKGTQILHFHAVAWNNENTVLVVKQGDNTLGSFNLYKDAGVKGTGPSYTLAGNNYDTDQYFSVNVAAYTTEGEAIITFTTTASPYRFVLYGVNQEGGDVKTLDRLEIAVDDTKTKKNYEAGESISTTGLTVTAIYTKGEETLEPVVVTKDVEWSFNPTELTVGLTSIQVTATYEGKSVSTDLEVSVSPVAPIKVDKATVSFGLVPYRYAKPDQVVTVTLIPEVTHVDITMTGDVDAFTLDKTELTESGTITIHPITAMYGAFSAVINLDAEGVPTKKINVSMTVETPNLPGICDHNDDFETYTGGAPSNYKDRTTTDGWTTTNTAVFTKDEQVYLVMDGNLNTVGTITSALQPEGIGTLKVRYSNVYNEAHGLNFMVEVFAEGNATPVYTQTVMRSNAEVNKQVIYTAKLTCNVPGPCYVKITNLCPSENNIENNHIDRLAIGNLCWTDCPSILGADATEEDFTENENLLVPSGITLTVNGTQNVGIITVEDGGHVIVAAASTAKSLVVENGGLADINDALTVTDLIISGGQGVSGQIFNAENINVTRNALFDVTLATEPDYDNYWYSFSIPFDVNLNDGFYTSDGSQMLNGINYQIWEYDGNKRTTAASGWKRISGNLRAGHAYLIGFEKYNEPTLLIKKNAAAISTPTDIALSAYSSTDETSANWNAVGNPTMKHIGLGGIDYVQIYNNDTHQFDICATDDYNFVVGTPFFAQATSTLSIENADHSEFRAPTRSLSDNIACGIRIAKENVSYYDNQIYVTSSDESVAEFVEGTDVPTLNGTTAATAVNMWVSAYGARLAVCDAPMENNIADYPLTMVAPATGNYILSAFTAPSNADVYLTRNGAVVWNLSAGEYPLSLTKGSNTAYGIRLVGKRPVATGVDNVLTGVDGQQIEKLILNGNLYIRRAGHIYDATGKLAE